MRKNRGHTWLNVRQSTRDFTRLFNRLFKIFFLLHAGHAQFKNMPNSLLKTFKGNEKKWWSHLAKRASIHVQFH